MSEKLRFQTETIFLRQPNEQIPPSPENNDNKNNKNFNILAGCLKKLSFTEL